MTGKERMLAAYRGEFPDDRIAVAPEFWYYYPARVLGVDMIEFEKDVHFPTALKTTFEKFGCEGWGITAPRIPNDRVDVTSSESWFDEDRLEIERRVNTPHGELKSRRQVSRDEPAWVVERPIKDWERDLPAWESATFGGSIEDMDIDGVMRDRKKVGDSYLLELWLGAPFFDTVGGAIEGGLEEAIFLFMREEEELHRLQEKFIDHLTRQIKTLCQKTPFESFAIGCNWSCNSLIGPQMWRKWDKPVIRAACEEVHRHDRLLHIHFHGQCRDTIEDFEELNLDCVCPFERPPGGDVEGLDGLQEVEDGLQRNVTMNGNVHTVETLIRGDTADVRREVGEIMTAFRGNPRVIVGTGDQVGRETPEENLHAMVEEARRLSDDWMADE